jgi:hypothetical protein
MKWRAQQQPKTPASQASASSLVGQGILPGGFPGDSPVQAQDTGRDQTQDTGRDISEQPSEDDTTMSSAARAAEAELQRKTRGDEIRADLELLNLSTIPKLDGQKSWYMWSTNVLVALNMLGISSWDELDGFDTKTLAHIGWKIRESLSPTVLATVAKIANAKELYDKLAARFDDVKTKEDLFTKMFVLTMQKEETTEAYVFRFEALVDEIRLTGDEVPDKLKLQAISRNLRFEYPSLQQAITNFRHLKGDATDEDVYNYIVEHIALPGNHKPKASDKDKKAGTTDKKIGAS